MNKNRFEGTMASFSPIFRRGPKLVIEETEEEFSIGDAISFNFMLNEASQIGEFPNLMDKTFTDGSIIYEYDKHPTPEKCSAKKLLLECRQLLDTQKMPKDSVNIIFQLISALQTAIRNESNIKIIW